MNCGNFAPKEECEGVGEYGMPVEALGLSHTTPALGRAFLKGSGSSDKQCFCVGKM